MGCVTLFKIEMTFSAMVMVGMITSWIRTIAYTICNIKPKHICGIGIYVGSLVGSGSYDVQV